MKKNLALLVFFLMLTTQAFAAASFVWDNAGLTALQSTGINPVLDQGKLRIYTSGYALLLAEFTLPIYTNNTVNGDATYGELKFDTVGAATAGNTGTAAVFRIYASNGSTLLCHGDVNTSGATINLGSLAINATQVVTLTNAKITIAPGS